MLETALMITAGIVFVAVVATVVLHVWINGATWRSDMSDIWSDIKSITCFYAH